jgi:transposase InsO family protein
VCRKERLVGPTKIGDLGDELGSHRFCEGPRVKFLRPTHPYVAVTTGFVYVAVILDAWSRRVVGYAISRSIDVRLRLAALNAAIEDRRPPAGCLHHSDSQRITASFRAA